MDLVRVEVQHVVLLLPRLLLLLGRLLLLLERLALSRRPPPGRFPRYRRFRRRQPALE